MESDGFSSPLLPDAPFAILFPPSAKLEGPSISAEGPINYKMAASKKPVFGLSVGEIVLPNRGKGGSVSFPQKFEKHLHYLHKRRILLKRKALRGVDGAKYLH